MKTQKTITCTVCPKGCQVTVTFDDSGNVAKITGNSCSKGEQYARDELVNPMRVLTSTVRVSGGAKPVVSVKTNKTIPLKKMIRCMGALRHFKAEAPVKIGDILIKDIAGTGASLVATSGTKRI